MSAFVQRDHLTVGQNLDRLSKETSLYLAQYALSAWHWLHIFLACHRLRPFRCLVKVSWFPVLATGWVSPAAFGKNVMVAFASYNLCVALGAGCVFSRAWRRPVFSRPWHRLLFSRAWHKLVFSTFPELGTCYVLPFLSFCFNFWVTDGVIKKKACRNWPYLIKEPVSPKVLCKLVFLFCSLAGAFAGRFANYTVPHWPFSKLIFTVVASEK